MVAGSFTRQIEIPVFVCTCCSQTFYAHCKYKYHEEEEPRFPGFGIILLLWKPVSHCLLHQSSQTSSLGTDRKSQMLVVTEQLQEWVTWLAIISFPTEGIPIPNKQFIAQFLIFPEKSWIIRQNAFKRTDNWERRTCSLGDLHQHRVADLWTEHGHSLKESLFGILTAPANKFSDWHKCKVLFSSYILKSECKETATLQNSPDLQFCSPSQGDLSRT